MTDKANIHELDRMTNQELADIIRYGTWAERAGGRESENEEALRLLVKRANLAIEGHA
jgi:hypothetical protein